MKKEQFERAKTIQALINSENSNIENVEKLGNCHELIIMNNSEEVQKAIKGMYHSVNSPAPIYLTGERKDLLVEALNKPRREHIAELQKEFDEM